MLHFWIVFRESMKSVVPKKCCLIATARFCIGICLDRVLLPLELIAVLDLSSSSHMASTVATTLWCAAKKDRLARNSVWFFHGDYAWEEARGRKPEHVVYRVIWYASCLVPSRQFCLFFKKVLIRFVSTCSFRWFIVGHFSIDKFNSREC